jgi:hypothetical protein
MLFRHPPLKFRPSTHGSSGVRVKAKDTDHADCFASPQRWARCEIRVSGARVPGQFAAIGNQRDAGAQRRSAASPVWRRALADRCRSRRSCLPTRHDRLHGSPTARGSSARTNRRGECGCRRAHRAPDRAPRCPRLRNDVIAIARVHGGIMVPVKHDRRHDPAVFLGRPAARSGHGTRVALPPRRPGRAESAGRRVSTRQDRARRSEHDRSGAYHKR